MNSLIKAISDTKSQVYWVVHPLDDLREQKRDVSAAGPMAVTSSVRLSLLALRGYLILMTGLAVYHFVGLAIALSHLAR